MNHNKPNYLNFLYDGNNFRGYGTESEIIAKGYSNYWATAITSELFSTLRAKRLSLKNKSPCFVKRARHIVQWAPTPGGPSSNSGYRAAML